MAVTRIGDLPDSWFEQVFLVEYQKPIIDWFKVIETPSQIKAKISLEVSKLKSLGDGGRKLIIMQRELQAGLLDPPNTFRFPRKGDGPRMLFASSGGRSGGKTYSTYKTEMVIADEING